MTSFPFKRIVKVTGAHVLGRYILVDRPAYVYTSNIIGLYQYVRSCYLSPPTTHMCHIYILVLRMCVNVYLLNL